MPPAALLGITVAIIIMTARMLRNREQLKLLCTCSKKQRANYIKSAPTSVINAVGDISNTLLRGNKIPIKPAHRTKLRRELKNLKKLAKKKGSIASKRKLLTSQKGGSILGMIWSVIKELF